MAAGAVAGASDTQTQGKAPAADCDLLVIGGGLAGMTAAVRAAQLGKRTILLEQGSDERYLCNTRITAGFFHTCLKDTLSNAGVLAAAIMTAFGGEAPPALAEAVARDGRRAVRWLQELGIRFMKASPEPHHNLVLVPLSARLGGLDWRGRGGDVLLRTLEAKFLALGGEVRRGMRADRLLQDGSGRCIGASAETADGRANFSARGTVIAAGGFESDEGMLRQHITPQPERVLQRNGGAGRGGALAMTLAAGAATTRLDGFYGHLQTREALRDATLWPYPWLDEIALVSVLIGPHGHRFVDEGGGGIHMANAVAALDDPASATLVFDDQVWETVGKSRFASPNPALLKSPGAILSAGSIAELAPAAGLSAESLIETVRAYNVALKEGTLDQLSPGRSEPKQKARPIEAPPFHAAPVSAGITYTLGGIVIDASARALDTNGIPIEGLYAAGGASGGLEGGDRHGYVGGLIIAAVTGLLAAEHFSGAAS